MKKKKIALVVDADNWAFANISNAIVKYVDKYDFEILPLSYFHNNLLKLYIAAKDCDLIHFFWRESVTQLDSNDDYAWLARQLGMTGIEEFKEKYVNDKIISTAVYDHMFTETEQEKTKEIFSKCSNYYVSSQILKDIYDNMDLKYKPKCVITDGVNLDEFYPKNEDRFKNIKKRNLVIGWVGNSEWNADKEDFKGVNTILKPAIKELQKEGYPIEMYFADRKERMIPHDQMIDYYSKIDVLICTSKNEGTPNPVMEAMACGVPFISTRVGIVPEVSGKKQSEYILEDRTKECLKENIIKYLNKLDSIEELRKENSKQIKNWSWQKVCKKFETYFDNIIKGE